jgi:hypothetical protein
MIKHCSHSGSSIAYGGMGSVFSMSKLLGSQSALNAWVQSSPAAGQSHKIEWTGPLVCALLRIDEVKMRETSGCPQYWLSHLEKLIIMSDVARVLTQNKKLDEGIVWVEVALDRRRHSCTELANC